MSDLAGAVSRLETASQVNPNDALAWLFRGVTYAFQNQGELARQTAQQLLKLAPNTSVERFLGMSASADNAFGKNMANAMRAAGIPDR